MYSYIIHIHIHTEGFNGQRRERERESARTPIDRSANRASSPPPLHARALYSRVIQSTGTKSAGKAILDTCTAAERPAVSGASSRCSVSRDTFLLYIYIYTFQRFYCIIIFLYRKKSSSTTVQTIYIDIVVCIHYHVCIYIYTSCIIYILCVRESISRCR